MGCPPVPPESRRASYRIREKNTHTEEQSKTEEAKEKPGFFLCLTLFLCMTKGVLSPDLISRVRHRGAAGAAGAGERWEEDAAPDPGSE
jgi:hypothetical protein